MIVFHLKMLKFPNKTKHKGRGRKFYCTHSLDELLNGMNELFNHQECAILAGQANVDTQINRLTQDPSKCSGT